MKMSTPTRYELFGGPLDGATMTLETPLKDNASVELDLVRKDFMPDLNQSMSIPNGKAVFILRDGRLTFDRIIPPTKKP